MPVLKILMASLPLLTTVALTWVLPVFSRVTARGTSRLVTSMTAALAAEARTVTVAKNFMVKIQEG